MDFANRGRPGTPNGQGARSLVKAVSPLWNVFWGLSHKKKKKKKKIPCIQLSMWGIVLFLVWLGTLGGSGEVGEVGGSS
jgi:hypothetical protein